MPARRSDQQAVERSAEVQEATELAMAWDTLAAAGAPVERKQREAWAHVRALETTSVPTRNG